MRPNWITGRACVIVPGSKRGSGFDSQVVFPSGLARSHVPMFPLGFPSALGQPPTKCSHVPDGFPRHNISRVPGGSHVPKHVQQSSFKTESVNYTLFLNSLRGCHCCGRVCVLHGMSASPTIFFQFVYHRIDSHHRLRVHLPAWRAVSAVTVVAVGDSTGDRAGATAPADGRVRRA